MRKKNKRFESGFLIRRSQDKGEVPFQKKTTRVEIPRALLSCMHTLSATLSLCSLVFFFFCLFRRREKKKKRIEGRSCQGQCSYKEMDAIFSQRRMKACCRHVTSLPRTSFFAMMNWCNRLAGSRWNESLSVEAPLHADKTQKSWVAVTEPLKVIIYNLFIYK